MICVYCNCRIYPRSADQVTCWCCDRIQTVPPGEPILEPIMIPDNEISRVICHAAFVRAWGGVSDDHP